MGRFLHTRWGAILYYTLVTLALLACCWLALLWLQPPT